MTLDNIERIASEVGYSSVGDGELMVEGLTKDDFDWLIEQAKKGGWENERFNL